MNFTELMTLRKAGLLGLALATVIGGCAPRDPETGNAIITANPQTASLYKQIDVKEINPVFVVKFANGDAGFSDMEKGRLLGFIEAQNAKYGDTLLVELPSFADPSGVNESRYGGIGSFLEDEGFQVSPKVERDGLANSLRIYFTKHIATVDPECAKGWRKPDGLNYENLPLPHMGCATASALAQMISDPKDLIDPQNMGGYDGERAAKSIQKYRLGGSGSSKGGKSAAGGK